MHQRLSPGDQRVEDTLKTPPSGDGAGGTAMRHALVLAVLLLLPAGLVLAPTAAAIDCTRTSTGLVPLNDLGSGTWNGAQGGLYPEGSNERPAHHTLAGQALAALAVPRNAQGLPDPVAGRSVFLSIGMSNTRNEFTSFVPLANADPLKHPRVLVVNGAIGGQTAARISDPEAPYWDQVDQLLAAAGATPLQVQAVWLKEADAGPTGDPLAYAATLQGELQAIHQILKTKFPHLWMVYLSSRIYAGYATTGLNPEPYAYASGFAVKWAIEDQLQGDWFAKDPAKRLLTPWLSWGPYLWADGLAPRSDGLVWLCSDFAQDGTHPNGAGSRKVAQQLLDFVHTDPTAKVWYEQAGGVALPGLAG